MITKTIKLIDSNTNKFIAEIKDVSILPPLGTYINLKDECYKVMAHNFNTLSTNTSTLFKANNYEIIVRRCRPYGNKLH